MGRDKVRHRCQTTTFADEVFQVSETSSWESRSRWLRMSLPCGKRRRSWINWISLLFRCVSAFRPNCRLLQLCIDFEARMATQLAQLHNRTRRIVKDQPLPVRKQHDYSQTPLGGNLRLFRGTNDTDKDQKSQEPNVRRILRDIQALFGSIRGGPEVILDQSNIGDTA